MAKITLDTLLSGFKAITGYNTNNSTIQDEFNNKVLYRNNPAGEPNQMENDLDMNGNSILNLPTPSSTLEPVRVVDLDSLAGATIQIGTKSYSTVASMKADTALAVGDMVTTKGYHTAGDGGGATYLVVAPQAFDGYGDHEIANGNIAVLQVEGYVNVKQYGAYSNGTNSATTSAAIQAALDSGAGTIFFPSGAYLVSASFSIADQRIEGESRDSVIITPASSAISSVFVLGGNGGVTNLTIDLDSAVVHGVTLTSFHETSGDFINGRLENCTIKGAGTGSTTAITAITLGTETTVTASGHSLINGDLVFIKDVIGVVSSSDPTRSEANGYFTVYDITSTTFKLARDCESFVPVNTTGGWTAYTSGGTVQAIGVGILCAKIEAYPSSQIAPHAVRNVQLENNFSHIVMFFARYMSFKDVLMKGNTVGHSIVFNSGVYQPRFTDCMIQSGIWAATGSRDAVFRNIHVLLHASWTGPVIDAIGTNATDGSEGGELAGFLFEGLSIDPQDVGYMGPFILTNGHDWAFKNCITRHNGATGNWTWANFESTLRLELTSLTFQSPIAWNLTDPTTGAGVHTRANGLWYTQGVTGTAYWGRQRYGSGLSNNSFISVRNSTLDHEIVPPGGLGGDRYIFEQIEGDVDLTNANGATTYLYAVSGTITGADKTSLSPDDYVKDAWTPALQFGTSITYDSQTGHYVQIKNIAYLYFEIDVSNSGADASPVTIGGISPPISSSYTVIACNIDINASTFFDIATNGEPHGEWRTANTIEFYKDTGVGYSYNNCNSSGIIRGVMTFLVD